MMHITYPFCWTLANDGESDNDRDRLRSINVLPNDDLAMEKLSVLGFADIKLIQCPLQSTDKREAALITIECEGPMKYITLEQIDIESNARFVEVYAVDKYLTTVKGEVITSDDGRTNGFYFSQQLRQQIITKQLRLKFLSVKSLPNSREGVVGTVVSSAVILHLVKLSLSVNGQGQRQPGLSITAAIPATDPLAILPHILPVREAFPSKGGALSSAAAAMFEMMARQQQDPGQQVTSSMSDLDGLRDGKAPVQDQQSISGGVGLSELIMMKSILLTDMERLLDKKLAPLFARLDRMQAQLDERLAIKSDLQRGIAGEKRGVREEKVRKEEEGEVDRDCAVQKDLINFDLNKSNSCSNRMKKEESNILTVSSGSKDDSMSTLATESVLDGGLISVRALMSRTVGEGTPDIMPHGNAGDDSVKMEAQAQTSDGIDTDMDGDENTLETVLEVAVDADTALKGDMRDLMLLLRNSASPLL